MSQLPFQADHAAQNGRDHQPRQRGAEYGAQLAAQQQFYKDAKDGDILIIYSTRAIIYDAVANKLGK